MLGFSSTNCFAIQLVVVVVICSQTFLQMLEPTDEAAIGIFQFGMTRLHEMTEFPLHVVLLRGLSPQRSTVQAAWSPATATCAFTCNLQFLANFTFPSKIFPAPPHAGLPIRNIQACGARPSLLSLWQAPFQATRTRSRLQPVNARHSWNCSATPRLCAVTVK